MMNILNQLNWLRHGPRLYNILEENHELTTVNKLAVGLPVSSMLGLGVFISCEINNVFS